MKKWKNLEKNPETGKISGKDNHLMICEKSTIHSVKKSEDLMKIRKNPEKSGKIRENPETGKFSGKENHHIICEKHSIHSVRNLKI